MLMVEEELKYISTRAAAGDFELVDILDRSSTEATFTLKLHNALLTVHLSEAGFRVTSPPERATQVGYPTIEGLLMSQSQQFTDDFFAQVCNRLESGFKAP